MGAICLRYIFSRIIGNTAYHVGTDFCIASIQYLGSRDLAQKRHVCSLGHGTEEIESASVGVGQWKERENAAATEIDVLVDCKLNIARQVVDCEHHALAVTVVPEV